MAIWRSPELEALFDGPVDRSGLTEAAIARLVDEGAAESDQVDFKRLLYGRTKGPRAGWSDEQEFAKDVSAFANHRGGVILVGVVEDDSIAKSLDPIPASVVPDREERRLRQALVNYQAPLAICMFIWIEVQAGGWHLAIVVPPSPRAPHAVLGDSGDPRTALRYPQRHGADTAWLSEPEVADRYRRRLSAQENEQQRVATVISQGAVALKRAAGIWIYAAVIPETPVAGRLDAPTVEAIERWHHAFSMPSPLGRGLPAYGRGIPAPGRVTFTGSLRSGEEDGVRVTGAYLELYVDGSAFAALPVDMSLGDGSAVVGEFALVDDTISLVDVTLRWCSRQVGAWGTSSVVSGFFDADSDDGSLRGPLALVSSNYGQPTRLRGTRTLTGEPATTTVADLSAASSVQDRLVVTHLVLCGLLQLFGRAEPKQVLADGSVDPFEFDNSYRRQVITWATDFDVDVAPAKR